MVFHVLAYCMLPPMTVELRALLTALRTDPEAREAIRRELLTEDLLALPGRMELGFATLAARVDQLAERMDQLAERMDQLAERMDQLAAAQTMTEKQLGQLAARLDERLDRLDGYVGSLRGAVYERAVLRPRMVAGAVGASPGTLRALSEGELESLLERALAADTLSHEHADAIEAANGVFLWDRGPEDPPVYCVVEVSITAHHNDLDRAAARAAWLAKTGVETRAVLLSDGVAAGVADSLKVQNVAWRRVQQPKAPLKL